MRPRIAAVTIAWNEEHHIGPCLASVSWADELLVVDAHSSDATAAVARAAGARVVLRHLDTFARQRNHAIDQARADWVLFVDADERVEQPLALEIAEKLEDADQGTDQPAGYWLPRRNIILGRWVRHAGWWPDYQLRLFRRDRARYDEHRDPHEVVHVRGPTAYLHNPLLHFNYASVPELFYKQFRYAQREARTLCAEGVRAQPRKFVTQPAREFHRRYIQLEGYKDGPLGLLLALIMAWYRFQVYANLRRMG